MLRLDENATALIHLDVKGKPARRQFTNQFPLMELFRERFIIGNGEDMILKLVRRLVVETLRRKHTWINSG